MVAASTDPAGALPILVPTVRPALTDEPLGGG